MEELGLSESVSVVRSHLSSLLTICMAPLLLYIDSYSRLNSYYLLVHYSSLSARTILLYGT